MSHDGAILVNGLMVTGAVDAFIHSGCTITPGVIVRRAIRADYEIGRLNAIFHCVVVVSVTSKAIVCHTR